jgi:CubicO group peptidase (beta-lactamase class C family)
LNRRIELKKIIDESSRKLGLSGAVYVKQGKDVLSESAYDYANKVEEIPNTIHTRFGIASGCKLFTAIGICQLVDHGVLSFDTPLKECLDIDFPSFSETITIHELLTHTSGIPDYFDEEVMKDYEDLWKERPVYQMRSLKDFLPLFQTDKMKFEPGDRFHYNNAGYILLGLIIEQQTGKEFADYIESAVFQKADMNSSGYFSMDGLPRNTAMGYIHNKDEDTWKTNIFSIPAKGGSDGGAFTTAPDMIKFCESLFDFTLVSEDTTRKLLTPHVLVKGEINYGYGIWMNKRNNDIYKYHVMGFDPGVSFRASVYPNIQLKVAIPSNNESDPFDITKAIEDYFFT